MGVASSALPISHRPAKSLHGSIGLLMKVPSQTSTALVVDIRPEL